jgi:hypothetical protein
VKINASEIVLDRRRVQISFTAAWVEISGPVGQGRRRLGHDRRRRVKVN